MSNAACTGHARHKKVLELAKGYRGRANSRLPHRASKRSRRGCATPIATGATRSAISARCGSSASMPARAKQGLTYSQFINGLKRAGHRARPQGAGRSRHARARGLQGDRGAGAAPRCPSRALGQGVEAAAIYAAGDADRPSPSRERDARRGRLRPASSCEAKRDDGESRPYPRRAVCARSRRRRVSTRWSRSGSAIARPQRAA